MLISIALLITCLCILGVVIADEGKSLSSSSTDFEPYSTDSLIMTFRLKPREDLKRGIANFVERHKLKAVTIVTCVGSLRQINVRLASSPTRRNETYLFRDNQFFEIVSLVGTFESSDFNKSTHGHVHISVADATGKVFGGHVMKGCVVYTTAEITIMENRRVKFSRSMCPLSGYEELEIQDRVPAVISTAETKMIDPPSTTQNNKPGVIDKLKGMWSFGRGGRTKKDDSKNTDKNDNTATTTNKQNFDDFL